MLLRLGASARVSRARTLVATSNMAALSSALSAPPAATPAPCRCLPLLPGSVAARSLHAPALLHATPPPAAPQMDPAELSKLREQHQAMRKYWNEFCTLMMRPQFTLATFEEMIKMQLGEAKEKASWRERLGSAIRQKAAALQGTSKEAEDQLRPIANVLAALTPDEKAANRLPPPDVRERISVSVSQPVEAVTDVFMRYDALMRMAEWYRWKMAGGESGKEEVPRLTNMEQLQAAMNEDAKRKRPFPKKTIMHMKMERNMKARRQVMKRR